jgi:hypothetical protein
LQQLSPTQYIGEEAEWARPRNRHLPSRHYGSASLERSSEVVQNRAAMRNESAVLRYYAKSQDPYQAQYPRAKEAIPPPPDPASEKKRKRRIQVIQSK